MVGADRDHSVRGQVTGNFQREHVPHTEAQAEELMIETGITLRAHLGDEVAVHDASALLRGGIQAQIVLEEKTYILRKTRAGKLILTK